MLLTFRHDVMHGYRQEEDGVTVVSPRACAEVLLHGLHYRKQLLCERHHVMKQHLQEDQHSGIKSVQQCGFSTSKLRACTLFSVLEGKEMLFVALQMQVSAEVSPSEITFIVSFIS